MIIIVYDLLYLPKGRYLKRVLSIKDMLRAFFTQVSDISLARTEKPGQTLRAGYILRE